MSFNASEKSCYFRQKKFRVDIGRKTTSLCILHCIVMHFKLHCSGIKIPSQGIF